MLCVNCKKETTNPKFCGRSCAVTYNNRISPKRKKQELLCKNCNGIFFKRHNANQIFCSNGCRGTWRTKSIKNAGRFDIDGQPSSKSVRRYLIETHGNICSVCENPAIWNDKQLTLIVDHIDGDAYNWTIKNMRLVCPNCDSQLPTFKGRNKGRSTRKYTITQK